MALFRSSMASWQMAVMWVSGPDTTMGICCMTEKTCQEGKKEEKGKIRNGMWEFDGTHSPQAIQVSVKPNPPKRSKHFEHPSILHAISLLFVSLIV
jgi:hypothetical protein